MCIRDRPQGGTLTVVAGVAAADDEDIPACRVDGPAVGKLAVQQASGHAGEVAVSYTNLDVYKRQVIGPRPALWNQYDLLAERDKYGANDVRPGLTGWAQIHGRDELEIAEKAKLDGWYVEHISFWLDVKCFFGTIRAVADHDGVVEGGTGTLHEEGK